MYEANSVILSCVDTAQPQVWSTLFEAMSTTLKESWGIALYADYPSSYCVDGLALHEHWKRQGTHMADLVEAVRAADPMCTVRERQVLEIYVTVNEILANELCFQSQVQQDVATFIASHPEVREDVALFMALVAYLQRSRISLTAQMDKVLKEISRLQASVGEKSDVSSPRAVAV